MGIYTAQCQASGIPTEPAVMLACERLRAQQYSINAIKKSWLDCRNAGSPDAYLAECMRQSIAGKPLYQVIASLSTEQVQKRVQQEQVYSGKTAPQPVFVTDLEPPKPWYKKPLVWAAIGGGVIVLGGGSYLLFRKR